MQIAVRPAANLRALLPSTVDPAMNGVLLLQTDLLLLPSP